MTPEAEGKDIRKLIVCGCQKCLEEAKIYLADAEAKLWSDIQCRVEKYLARHVHKED